MQPEDKKPENGDIPEDIKETPDVPEDIEEVIADLREEAAKAEPQAAEPQPETPAPRLMRWTVIVGRQSQQIKLGDSPLYVDVAAAQVMAPSVDVARLEAKLALVRQFPESESDHWVPIFTYVGFQEVIHGSS